MADYTLLEYIESTGTQFIDTGIGNAYEITMDVQFINNGANEQLMGQSASGGQYFGINKNGYLENGLSQAFSYLGTERRNIHIIRTQQNQTITVEGETLIVDRGGISAVTFKLLGGVGERYPCSAKLYSCQFYDNGTLVRDYVPCVTSDGEIGLWDMVEDKFYGNAGTGTFVAGPDVIVPVEPLDPTSMTMGWLVGRAVASQRK